MAELREGVWLRPDNLDRPLDEAADHCLLFNSHHRDPVALARRLWDLDGWADNARRLIAELDTTHGLRDEFLLVAHTVQHLKADPVLPPDLLSAQWPGPELRDRYTQFRDAYALRLREFSDG